MYHQIDVFAETTKSVTDKDLDMLIRIYGEDGFGGMVTPSFKVGYYTAGDTEICTHKCTINRTSIFYGLY